MNPSHLAAVIASEALPPSTAVTVWLTSGEKITGISYTYDVSGLATLEQPSGPPIIIDLAHIMAIQKTAEPP